MTEEDDQWRGYVVRWKLLRPRQRQEDLARLTPEQRAEFDRTLASMGGLESASAARRRVWGCGCLIFILVATCVVVVITPSTNERPSNAPTPAPATTAQKRDYHTSLWGKILVSFSGTDFELANMDPEGAVWTDCDLEIDRGYFSSAFSTRIEHVETKVYRIPALAFANKDGKRFDPIAYKPRNLRIDCMTPNGRASYTYDIPD